MTAMAIAVLGALAAACMFGLSTVLMFRAAQQAPSSDVLKLRLLGRLLHSRLWLAGVSLQAASFLVQAVALAFGPLSLVQPLAATDLLFALPFLAHACRRRMQSREWVGAALVAGGVGLFVGVSPPHEGVRVPALTDWLAAVVLVAVAVGLGSTVALRTAGRTRTTLLAGAAAATFALLDALSKAAVGDLRARGVVPMLTSWHPWALLVVGVTGMLLAQSAFQSGSLQVSLPVIDTLEPALAVVLGAFVFHEALAKSPMLFAVQVAGGCVALLGIVTLDRSPVMIAKQQEEAARPSAPADEGPPRSGQPGDPPPGHTAVGRRSPTSGG